jgi:hypothetical protein
MSYEWNEGNAAGKREEMGVRKILSTSNISDSMRQSCEWEKVNVRI